jgi:hypothetical protein
MRKQTLLSIALAMSAFAPGTGNAQAAVTLQITSITSEWSNAPTADLTYVRAGPDYRVNNVRVTPFVTKGVLNNNGATSTVSLLTWCVDIFQTIHSGSYGVTSLSSFIGDATKAAYISALIGHEDLASVSKEHDAAVQLALWELLYEGDNTNPNFLTGTFEASDISSSILNAAKTYATNAKTIWQPVSGIEIQIASSGRYQDQLFFTALPCTPAVPEPATWGMMILGFGAIGSAMRYRWTKATINFAQTSPRRPLP